MYRTGNVFSHRLIDSYCLCTIRSNDTYAFRVGTCRQHLLRNDIYFPLVEMSSGMISRYSLNHLQYILLLFVSSHGNQLPIVEALIAEFDDFGMAAVMFPKQGHRSIFENFCTRLQKTVCHSIVPFIHLISRLNGIQSQCLFPAYHIGQLFVIPYNYGIYRTRQGQRPRLDIHLRSFVHNHIVKHHLFADAAFGRISSAEYNRIFFQKLLCSGLDILDGKPCPVAGMISSGYLVFQELERRRPKPFHVFLNIYALKFSSNRFQFLFNLCLPGNVVSRFQASYDR